MSETQTLTFISSTATVLLGIGIVAVTAVLCFVAWRRSGFARGTGLLESLRLLLVVLVVVTLNQPEWLREYRPTQKSTLAVLWDDSKSMQTRDVIDQQRPADTPKTRRECIEPFLQEAIWKPISSRMDVVFEPFSSSLPDPREGTDLAEALVNAMDRHEQLRGVVLLSDGDWNTGEPPIRAATRLRMQEIPVFAVGVGSESHLPDIDLLDVDAPSFGVVRKTMRIPFVIRSSLPRDYEVTVSLTASTGEEITKQVCVPAMGQLQDTLSWRPEKTGDCTLTMRVPAEDSERIETNNEHSMPIEIRDEALQVLLVESFPRWEYRYLRNALERDPGVEVTCLLFHPGLTKVGGGRGYVKAFPSRQELNEFDVIFLGDVGIGDGQLTLEQCKLLRDVVRNHAAGVVFMPGLRGRHATLLQTELDDLYPVVLDPTQPGGWGSQTPGQFELTEAGHRSLLTNLEESDDTNSELWQSLPGFQWYAAALRAKAGCEVLAVHQTESSAQGRVPLIVTKTYGTGKVLFMGTDGAWRWRQGVEDKYHYRFWGQVARWMAYQRNMAKGETMRLFFSPDQPRLQQTLTLNANVMEPSGEPLSQGDVAARIVAPSGKAETVRFSSSGDEWGAFSGRFTSEEPGQHEVTLTCKQTNAVLKASFFVQGDAAERAGKPARPEVLDEIARVSRGKVIKLGNVAEIIHSLSVLPDPPATIHRVQLWSHPLVAGALILLLGVFWVARKVVGLI